MFAENKTIVVTRVDNGYLIRVTRQGVSELKRLYNTPAKVFTSLKDLCNWVEENLALNEED